MGRTAKSAQGVRAGEREARIANARQWRLELDKDKDGLSRLARKVTPTPG
jgi:hypothetical protein